MLCYQVSEVMSIAVSNICLTFWLVLGGCWPLVVCLFFSFGFFWALVLIWWCKSGGIWCGLVGFLAFFWFCGQWRFFLSIYVCFLVIIDTILLFFYKNCVFGSGYGDCAIMGGVYFSNFLYFGFVFFNHFNFFNSSVVVHFVRQRWKQMDYNRWTVRWMM